MLKTKSILFSILTWVAFGNLQSAPIVSKVTGSISNESVVTVEGSGFGSKTNPTPLCHDGFESGTFDPYWNDSGNLTISQEIQRHPSSSFVAHHNFTRNSGNRGYLTGKNSVVSPKWYVSYWVYLADNWDWGTTDFSGNNKFLSNVKVFRMWNPGDTSENFVVAHHGWGNDAVDLVENTDDPGEYFFSGWREAFSKGSWHLLEFEYQESSDFGKSDGVFRFWFDGELKSNRKNLISRESGASTTDGENNKRPYIVGFYNSWSSGENGGGGADPSDDAPNDFYLDDIYVDNSWSRVLIGNAPTYDASTHREIQVPISWKRSEVTFQLSQGSFSLEDPKYLYVINNHGVVNSEGFLLSSSPEPIPTPEPPEEPSRSVYIFVCDSEGTCKSGFARVPGASETGHLSISTNVVISEGLSWE